MGTNFWWAIRVWVQLLKFGFKERRKRFNNKSVVNFWISESSYEKHTNKEKTKGLDWTYVFLRLLTEYKLAQENVGSSPDLFVPDEIK